MISCSDRLQYVHSDIRGPLYLEALRMEAEGTSVLKLNTGNPGRFGFPLSSVCRAIVITSGWMPFSTFRQSLQTPQGRRGASGEAQSMACASSMAAA